MRSIVKRFPGVLANAGVDFDLLPGEVHALLGENGAGKSTLMNVLYGLHVADEGEIFLRGKRVAFHSAADAIDAGLGMVHQHFMLVKPFTVAENIVLGRASPRAPFLEDRRAVEKRLIALSQQYGLQIDPSAPVWTLSVGEQQRVEILKALYRGADVLILDEPTAVLTPQEWTGLLAIVRRLQAEGKSIVFISHKLGEVLAVADRITVMRDGRVVGETRTQGTDKNTLARMMVGRDVMLVVPKGPASPGAPVLSVTEARADNDRGLPALQGVSLEVRAGEILGIAGVAGNGQTELEEVIAGLRPLTAGSVTVCGRPLPARGGTVPGLAHVPSDRYGMAMLKDFSIAENLVLQNVGEPPFTSRGFLDRGAIGSNARNLVSDFDVRTPSIETMAGNLSGGNAQKMVLARELSRAPKVLLAAQPTRGLDVAAIEFVHNKLVEQRDAGVGVLLISTELDEILALSDRIAVMYEGQIVGIVDPNDIDVKDIGLMMAGQRAAPPGDAARGV
ncbi:MAG: ABC transporter ATP-binding protein [Anaerolineae bacterium]|jgi:simple sugar transport system ATP-binding protein|nr:ABC transporter ATP-binding protein [Anaerolineae bacterium]